MIVQEQFTAVSEEKEVGEIKAEVSEAKKNPTPGTLLLLGRYVSSSAVGVLLNRFMLVLNSTHIQLSCFDIDEHYCFQKCCGFANICENDLTREKSAFYVCQWSEGQ